MPFPFGGGFDASGIATSAWSPFIGAQAGADDLWIVPGGAAYPAANATVYRVYEYAVPVTTVATVPSAYPTVAGIPGIAAYPAVPGAI
ncbi:MAG: hypothetical protein DIU70_000225 [Bacillota bacterium]|nr:MAG: hypothetical protein DIU70_04105 [Bacillota bacterium]